MRHRNFSNSDSWKVHEVPMYESANGLAFDEISTTGLGPCIGIAFAFEGVGYLLHEPSLSQNPEPLEKLLEYACRNIPASERAAIRPVLAGGALNCAEDTEMARDCRGDDGPLPNDEIPKDRRVCVESLIAKGFGTPHERWCLGQSQSLHLDVKRSWVRVVTESADGESVEEELFAR